jgi:DNA polymerase III delta prime subunit
VVDSSPQLSQSVPGSGNIFTGTGSVFVGTGPATVSLADARTYRDLRTLLRGVKTVWIDGFLKQSIHNLVKMELGMRLELDAIDHPWGKLLQLPEEPEYTLPTDSKIIDIFIEHNNALLILGEPGSGKTTTLLELVKDLIIAIEAEEYFTQPIPVVFSLSTWGETKSDLADWLVEELVTKYRIPRRIGRPWLQEHWILPLLDGLDEVNEPVRAACVEAINKFEEEYGLAGVAVTCRTKEYTDLPVRLKLNGAVTLLPLSKEQVDTYVKQFGPPLEFLRHNLARDNQLLTLAQKPFLLSLMCLTFQDGVADLPNYMTISSLEEMRKYLIDAYIERMFRRRNSVNG